MNHTNKRRTGLGGLLALALGAVVLLVMAGPAVAKDRNHDHIPDRWEMRHRLSLNVNQARRDQDHDGLRNLAEFRAGDNPRKADSDGDGIPDGEENAGTIASFDPTTGMLVIDLFGTETVSGLVTEETEISCEDSSGSAGMSSDEQSGDDNGGQGQESGDDNGGEEDVGDDNSGPGGDDNSEEGNCTTADLVTGAVVHEADLQVANGTATFDEVDLG
jgi:hypothetical protein